MEDAKETSQHTSSIDPNSLKSDPLAYLPEAPVEPLPTDCCGTGCAPCVMDIFQAELETWLKLKAMSPEERAKWRRQRLSTTEKPCGLKCALSTVEYQTLLVQNVKQVASDSFVFTFTLPSGYCLGFQTGQHYILRGIDSSGQYLTRQYTPISPPDQTGSFDVLIKLYEYGSMSRCVRQWMVGSTAEWKGPFGGLSYYTNKYKHIGMLACGTGIAPMIQVIRTVIENDNENTFLHLVYSSQDQDSILMKQELDTYNSYWNFTVLYVLSRVKDTAVEGQPGLIKYGDKVHYGRIHLDLVKQEMPEANTDSLVLICGTRTFDKDMINHLKKNGFTDKMYHKF